MDMTEKFIKNTKKLIDEFGHTVFYIDTSPWPYSYTVGLTDKVGYELYTIGLPPNTATTILNTLAILLGQTHIKDNEKIPELANAPMILRTMWLEPQNEKRFKQIVPMTFNFGYKPDEIRQLYWPDVNGYFPWEEQYSSLCLQDIKEIYP